MTKEMFIGKSKKEIMAMLPSDIKADYFENKKGIPQAIVICGKGIYLHLFFNKKTRRIEC
jgi:hypothetical protein